MIRPLWSSCRQQITSNAVCPAADFDAGTGARRGELLGLQWSDLEGNRLMIGRSLSQGRAAGLPQGAEDQEVRRRDDSGFRAQEAPGASKKATAAPGPFR
jgi:integrase